MFLFARYAVFVIVTARLSIGQSCGNWWHTEPVGGKCYFSNSRLKLNWFEAMHFCETLGGRLAVPKSAMENNYVARIAKHHHESHVWIGVSDILIEGRWLEYPLLRDVTFTDWGPGEPSNGHGRAHCGNLLRDHDYHWNDSYCFFRFGFVCEKQK